MSSYGEEYKAIGHYPKRQTLSNLYSYSNDYNGPRDLKEQVETLINAFPELWEHEPQMFRRGIRRPPTPRLIPKVPNYSLANAPLPSGAEGYFAIPRWQTIDESYEGAVQKVFNALKRRTQGLSSFHDSSLFSHHWSIRSRHTSQKYIDLWETVWPSRKSVNFWKKLEARQEGYDILVVPAQFGFRYRGCSPTLVDDMMKKNERGLGAFAVGIMLLTHPERLRSYGVLAIQCPGDEMSGIYPWPKEHLPIFSFVSDRLTFYCGYRDFEDHRDGAATAFFP